MTDYTIRIETGDSQYWQERRKRAMDVLSARIGIGAMSAWFDTLPDPIRGGCAMTLALVYEKKLNETMPFDPDECTCDPDPNRESMACLACRAATLHEDELPF